MTNCTMSSFSAADVSCAVMYKQVRPNKWSGHCTRAAQNVRAVVLSTVLMSVSYWWYLGYLEVHLQVQSKTVWMNAEINSEPTHVGCMICIYWVFWLYNLLSMLNENHLTSRAWVCEITSQTQALIIFLSCGWMCLLVCAWIFPCLMTFVSCRGHFVFSLYTWQFKEKCTVHLFLKQTLCSKVSLTWINC